MLMIATLTLSWDDVADVLTGFENAGMLAEAAIWDSILSGMSMDTFRSDQPVDLTSREGRMELCKMVEALDNGTVK